MIKDAASHIKSQRTAAAAAVRCPACGASCEPKARYCPSCGASVTSAKAPRSSRDAAARRVRDAAAYLAMVIAQMLGMLWLGVLSFTSGSDILTMSAFIGLLGYSVVAWMVARQHPARGLLFMVMGTAAMAGLLVVADGQGWLGA